MTARASFSPRARRDLLEQVVYLAEQADEETARRYYDAVRATTTTLVEHPSSGALFKTSTPRLQGLRYTPVKRPFEKHLIFYQPANPGIHIVRVLHAARDIAAILQHE